MEDDQPTVFEPPFYLLETEAECWECGKQQRVCALVSNRAREEAYDDPVMIKYAEWIPKNLRLEIVTRNPRYGLAKTKTSGRTYYANSCECGAVMGDHYLHNPDAAFFPMDREGMARIRVQKLEYSEAFRTMADPSWGVAERLLEG
jgi:hypothetical protein